MLKGRNSLLIPHTKIYSTKNSKHYIEPKNFGVWMEACGDHYLFGNKLVG
jgi:hypothetical protein